MYKHVVMFKLKGTLAEKNDVAERFAEALRLLPGQIPCLQSIEVGINCNPAEHWNIVLTAVLPTFDDIDVYARHPAHVAAASIISEWREARACVDYLLPD